MSGKISIKIDSSGKVTNRYFEVLDHDSWIVTKSSNWPEPDSDDDETYSFYYDESTGEITVEYSQKETTNDIEE